MISRKLRLLMAHRDINQRELAEKLGVSPVIVSEWLNEKKTPSVYKLKLLADYFNTTMDKLFEDSDMDQDPDIAVKEMTSKDKTQDLDLELQRAIEGLPNELKQDIIDMAEDLSKKLKGRIENIEKEFSRRHPK